MILTGDSNNWSYDMTNENTIKTEQGAQVLPIEEAYKDDNDLVAKWKRDLCLFNFE
jgi:hypothetical protein